MLYLKLIIKKLSRNNTMKSFHRSILTAVIIAIIFAGILGASLLLYRFTVPFSNNHNPQNIENNDTNNVSDDFSDPKDFVIHKTLNLKINGLEQVINILEVDISTNKIKIKPVLSYDSIYGFELLSEIAQKHKAYAAINAGFFYEYGEPSGMVVIDGEIITGSTGKYPVFIIDEGIAQLKQVETLLYLKPVKDKTQLNSLKSDKINVDGKPGEWVLYTRRYGTDNRVKRDNITLVIENNILTEIVKSDKETKIPPNGMLATYIEQLPKQGSNSLRDGELQVNSLTIPFTIGEEVKLEYKPDLGINAQAYECGSWIIKDKEIVISEKDPWVGVLTNRDPRTAIGIKESGEVVIITVDGRQPGYSYGFMARELGEFLVQYGVKDAAMLDGGASTEMIIEGEIINRPSFRASERPLAGAIIVEVE